MRPVSCETVDLGEGEGFSKPPKWPYVAILEVRVVLWGDAPRRAGWAFQRLSGNALSGQSISNPGKSFTMRMVSRLTVTIRWNRCSG